MAVYYNELDKFAAAWLRELMKAGQIPDGEVDERSIELVQPDDLRGFRQCHFFAGIGGWAYALTLAGWGDRPAWTGSCPCQPFSSAGAQVGGDDPRHLWPTWFRLIRECRPDVVFGEQVEAAIGHGWLDLVFDDLEREGYAAGAVSLASPCVGAFDIRQRLWFVADANGRDAINGSLQRGGQHGLRAKDRRADGRSGDGERAEGELADAHGQRRTGERLLLRPEEGGRLKGDLPQAAWSGEAGELGQSGQSRLEGYAGNGDDRHQSRWIDSPTTRPVTKTSAPSFWDACDWIPCADGKARPVEPGTFPLADGVSARVGRLRGYGNAIKPQVAQVFIEAYLEARHP